MGFLDGWRHCPRCASPLEGDRERVACAACGFVVYANPAPAACALVEEEGRLLLGRRAWEPYAGMWDLPGGFLAEEELPLDGLRRELLEETGLQVEPTGWFGAYMVPYQGRTVLNLVWRARVLGGVMRPADDVTEQRWFARDELPPRDEIAMAETVVDWLG
jgi:ADP-ribose pyrophosphatase YjhB (NUDIX family)